MFRVETEFPIAFDSPDHLMPWGTKRDNHSSTSFITEVISYLGLDRKIKFMDLGCSGGGLVKEWLRYTKHSVGLEGSDYSLKHERAEWPTLYNKSLFTCDISRPYKVYYNDDNYKCNLISAWEVIEHIDPTRLDVFFKNIWDHLEDGGIFVGSGATESDMPEGVELHLSAFPKEKWINELIPTDMFEFEEYPIKSVVRTGCDFYFCLKKIGGTSFRTFSSLHAAQKKKIFTDDKVVL